jgi:hypothetical protein
MNKQRKAGGRPQAALARFLVRSGGLGLSLKFPPGFVQSFTDLTDSPAGDMETPHNLANATFHGQLLGDFSRSRTLHLESSRKIDPKGDLLGNGCPMIL